MWLVILPNLLDTHVASIDRHKLNILSRTLDISCHTGYIAYETLDYDVETQFSLKRRNISI